ncbi:MAG: hypothetical protein ACTSPG_03795 [Candidatus Hodarchaeales archaeon]
MKKVKLHGQLSLIIFILIFGIGPSFLEPIKALPFETKTTIIPSIGTVGAGDILNFSVWVYSEWDPVDTGVVRISDLNTSEKYETSLSGGKAEVQWGIGSSYLVGNHVFLAEYLGFGDYLPSEGKCTVYFDEIEEGTYRETSTTLTSNSTVVYKNASVRFDIEVKIPYSWFFDGGFIYIRNTNLSGSNNIHTYGPLPYTSGPDPTVFTYSFEYQIPVFTPVGKNLFVAEYSGSTDSLTQSSISSLIAVTVRSTGYTLSQELNKSWIQRNEESLGIQTTILGDYPAGLELRSYYVSGENRVYFANVTVEGRVINTTFEPNSSVQVGNLSLVTELVDPSTETQYANVTKFVDIIDRARIDESLNSTEYRHNETIEFSVYITEEDVFTHSVVCVVELIDVTDDNKSIINKSTNQDGFVVINYKIPTNATVGEHLYSLRTHESPEYILDVEKIVNVNIKGLTEIDITYESSGVLRGEFTPIQVIVLSGGTPLNEGQVSLEFLNGTIIETKSCAPGVEFQYYIKLNHHLGSMTYQIYYSGTNNYDSHTKQFVLTVFSRPSFNYTKINATEVVKGQSVRIWGQLIDETGSVVSYEEVKITDTTTGVFLGTSITSADGIFYFDYYISDSSQIGLHFVETRYDGNVLKFYYSSPDKPTVSFTVRPPLSVMIDNEILSDSYTIISLSGGLGDEVNISWQQDGETTWDYITSIVLNSTGYGEYNWSTPAYYKGKLTIRAEGSNSTKYDYSEMYSIPEILIEAESIGNVDNDFIFRVNSTEKFQIWIQDQLWQDWTEGGFYEYNYIFTSTGLKEIKVISNDTFVYYNEKHEQVAVYEELSITLSVPNETYVNLTTNIDGTIVGESSGPIQNLDIILEINGTQVQIDSSNSAGNYYFNPLFSEPGIYIVQAKTNTSEDRFYFASESSKVTIQVHSIPASIVVQSPANETYGAIVEISFGGNAEEYWYWIEPVDNQNNSWTGTSYRQLVEGSYVVHVYGTNEYGVISYMNSSFTVDTTSPTVALVSPLNTSYTRTDVLLEYIHDEGKVRIYLDDELLTNPASGMYLNDLSEGLHNLTVRIEDLVGNFMTQRAYFEIDTIPPSLVVNSPRNQSYTGEVLISITSNGSTVLYQIEGIHTYNQTYTEEFYLNLSYDSYKIHIYAFDTAGNIVHRIIEFSVVKSISLLIDTNVEKLDNAGRYLVSTGIISHPDFDTTGLMVNGTSLRLLEWNPLAQKYQLEIQLEYPGKWEITVFARTNSEEYDFASFIVIWDNPETKLEQASIVWDDFEEVYAIQLIFADNSVPIDLVRILVNNSSYDLSYEPFWNRWVANIPIEPSNYTFYIETWYEWNQDRPGGEFEYNVNWYAPVIEITSMEPSRSDFTLELRIERKNVTIDSESIMMVLNNGSMMINISGRLIYESIIGDYQDWAFDTPDLVPGFWTYTIYASDSYGVTRSAMGVFNNSDSPPEIISFSFKHIKEYDTENTEYWVLALQVIDDYAIAMIRVIINGFEYKGSPEFNGSHYMFTFYLNQGIHTFIVKVVDDINQTTEKVLQTIRVDVDVSSSYTSSSNNTSFEVPDENKPRTIQKGLSELAGVGVLLLIVIVGIIVKKIPK